MWWGLLLATRDARAEDGDKHVSVTLSAYNLLFKVPELTVEGRVGPLGGLSLVGGWAHPGDGVEWDVGAQGQYYPVGTFDHGMQLGAEALVLRSHVESTGATSAVTGLSIGPYLGYKYVAPFGLTVNGQLGVGYVALSGTASAGGGREQPLLVHAVRPIINVNFGWSF